MKASRERRAAGFSLLEILVALAILTVAFAIIWTSFSATISAWRRGSDMMDRLHRGDFVMEQLVAGLRSAAMFSNRPDKYGFHLKDAGGGADSHDELGWVTASTAFLPAESPLANTLHRIVVTVGDDPEGRSALSIKAFPHLADLDSDSVEIEEWFVSTEIQGLSCRVWNAEEEDWDEEWEDTNSIPRLVQLTLYMTPLEDERDPVVLRRLVEIPVAPPLAEAARPDGGTVTNQPAPAAGGAQPAGGGTAGGGGQPAAGIGRGP